MMKRSLTVAMLVAGGALGQSGAALAQSGARAADVVAPQETFRMRAERAAAQGIPFIENFSARPSPDLKAGSELAVSLRGTPGAEVDLAIQGVRGVIKLPEVRYGEYATNYSIRGGDRISERSEVSVTMRFRSKVASKTLGQPLSLAAAAPNAASPASAATQSGSKAPSASCANCATIQAVNVVNLSDATAQGANGAAGTGGPTISVGPGAAYRYDVVVRYADGRLVTMPFDNDPGLSAGEQVRINDGVILRESAAF